MTSLPSKDAQGLRSNFDTERTQSLHMAEEHGRVEWTAWRVFTAVNKCSQYLPIRNMSASWTELLICNQQWICNYQGYQGLIAYWQNKAVRVSRNSGVPLTCELCRKECRAPYSLNMRTPTTEWIKIPSSLLRSDAEKLLKRSKNSVWEHMARVWRFYVPMTASNWALPAGGLGRTAWADLSGADLHWTALS